MSFDEKPDRFIFVNAPTIIDAGPRDARRQLRSQLMRRVHFKKYQVQSPYLAELIDQIGNEQVDELTQCRCDVSSSSSAPPSTGQIQRPTSPAKTNAYHTTNTSSKRRSYPFPPSPVQEGFSVHICERYGHWRSSFTPSCAEMDESMFVLERKEYISDPLQTIAAGVMDPFGEPRNSSDFPNCHQLVTQYIHHVLPSLRCSQEWLQAQYSEYVLALRIPLLFHAICLCGSVALERKIENQSEKDRKNRLRDQNYYRYMAVRELRQTLAKLRFDTQTFYEVVTCITLLALNDPLGEMPQWFHKQDYNPFSHPLQNLGGLNVYGFASIHPVHWQGLLAFMEKHGGFHALQLYGARWKLFYTGLKYAVHTSTKPAFPAVDVDGNNLLFTSPSKLLGTAPSDITQTGFRCLKQFHIRKSILLTFLDLRELAQGIDTLNPRSGDGPTRDKILDARNLVEYRFLNLPRMTDPLSAIVDVLEEEIDDKTANTAMTLYEMSWLAASIFTTHVTFPLPSARCYRVKQVPQLSFALTSSEHIVREHRELEELRLWCAMIGGITAGDLGPAIRSWWAARVRQLCEALDLKTWSEVQQLMRSFVWTNVACDHSGNKLWVETGLGED